MSLNSHPVVLVDIFHEYGTGNTKVQVLAGINLQVEPGELLAIMGPSGSGKSTLLAIAGGLERPTSGKVYIHGESFADMSSVECARVRRKSIGYVFRDSNLLPTLTAVENVEMPLELDGFSSSKARDAALFALEEVGALDLAEKFPDDLNGREQQQVAIARALVGRRSIIMADEPTGSLDSHSGEQIMLALRQQIDAGAAGILATHEARFAAWADRTVFLRDGKMTDTSSSDRIEDLL